MPMQNEESNLIRVTTAKEIIDLLRVRIIRAVPTVADWDEYVNGACWLDNEIGFYDEAYSIVRQELHPTPDYAEAASVAEALELLIQQPIEHLNALRRFVRNHVQPPTDVIPFEPIRTYRLQGKVSADQMQQLIQLLA